MSIFEKPSQSLFHIINLINIKNVFLIINNILPVVKMTEVNIILHMICIIINYYCDIYQNYLLKKYIIFTQK